MTYKVKAYNEKMYAHTKRLSTSEAPAPSRLPCTFFPVFVETSFTSSTFFSELCKSSDKSSVLSDLK